MAIIVATLDAAQQMRRQGHRLTVCHICGSHSVLNNPFMPAVVKPALDPACADMALKAYKYFLWLVDQAEPGAELPELVKEVWSGMSRSQRSLVALNNYWSAMHRTQTVRDALKSVMDASLVQNVYLVGYSTTVHGPGIKAFCEYKVSTNRSVAA